MHSYFSIIIMKMNNEQFYACKYQVKYSTNIFLINLASVREDVSGVDDVGGCSRVSTDSNQASLILSPCISHILCNIHAAATM